MRRVLIVDDYPESAELISAVLEGQGHATRIAHHPHEAIPMAVEFMPHVAFLDIGLPEMDGFELARVLRQKPGLSKCKLVAVTGYDDASGRQRGSSDFDAHLVKPIDLSKLLSMVFELEWPDASPKTSAK